MLCWFFRFMISHAADSDRRIGPWTHRHMLRCTACRWFHQNCRLLAEGLRAEASMLPSTGYDRLRHTRRWHIQGPAIWSGIAAAACIVLAVYAGISLWDGHAESARPPLAPAFTATAVRWNLTATWTRALETPLVTEVQNLSNDAQSGIRFLVSCLNIRPFDDLTAPSLGQSEPPSIQ